MTPPSPPERASEEVVVRLTREEIEGVLNDDGSKWQPDSLEPKLRAALSSPSTPTGERWRVYVCECGGVWNEKAIDPPKDHEHRTQAVEVVPAPTGERWTLVADKQIVDPKGTQTQYLRVASGRLLKPNEQITLVPAAPKEKIR